MMPYGVDLDRIDRPRECKHLCGRDQAGKGALGGAYEMNKRAHTNKEVHRVRQGSRKRE